MACSSVSLEKEYLFAYLYPRHPSTVKGASSENHAVELCVPSAKIAFGKGYMIHAEGLRNHRVISKGVEVAAPVQSVSVSTSLVTDAVAAVKQWTEAQNQITQTIERAREYLTAVSLGTGEADTCLAHKVQEERVLVYLYQVRVSAQSPHAEFCAGRDDILEMYLPTIERAVGIGYIHETHAPRNSHTSHVNGFKSVTPLFLISVPKSLVESVSRADSARISVQPRIDTLELF